MYKPKHAEEPSPYQKNFDSLRYALSLDEQNTPSTVPLGFKESMRLLLPSDVKERLKESPLNKAVGKLALRALGVAQSAAAHAREAIAPKERRVRPSSYKGRHIQPAEQPLARQAMLRPDWDALSTQEHPSVVPGQTYVLPHAMPDAQSPVGEIHKVHNTHTPESKDTGFLGVGEMMDEKTRELPQVNAIPRQPVAQHVRHGIQPPVPDDHRQLTHV